MVISSFRFIYIITFPLLALAVFPRLAYGEEKIHRGLHWYEKSEIPVVKKEQEKEEFPAPVVPEVSKLMAMHPKKIRALFEEVHEYHVMAPTLETARQMQVIKAVMSRKARAAAAVEQLAILQNPGISGVAENAVNPSARSVQRKERDSSIDSRLMHENSNFALIMLTQKGCSACDLQRATLAAFADKYGWPVKEVDIQEKPEAANRFNVQVTPTTLIAGKQSKDWQTVAIGAETLTSMTNNVHQALRLLLGEISPNQWLTAPNQTNSLYDPNVN